MDLSTVKEIKECHSQSEVNSLLETRNWVLLEIKVEKVRKPDGKEKVGVVATSDWNHGPRSYDTFEIKYVESLESIYFLGRL